MRSGGVSGLSLNFLIVKELPLVVTSLPRVSCILEPSGIVASSSGSAMEICLPQICAMRTTEASSSFSSSKEMFVSIDSYFLWYTYNGV